LIDVYKSNILIFFPVFPLHNLLEKKNIPFGYLTADSLKILFKKKKQ